MSLSLSLSLCVGEGGGNTGNQAWPETKVGLAGKVGGMTFWKQISQANLPLPLFLLIILFSRSLPSRRTPLSERLKQVTFYFAGSLSSVEASLYRRPGGLDRWKKKAWGGRWEGERGKSVVPHALSIFWLLLFLLGYPEGASVEERVAGLDATRRGLGTGKTV